MSEGCQSTAKVAEILARYRELCDYCTALSRRVAARFGSGWRCTAGCSGCCRLETVCGLEALVLLTGGAGEDSLSAVPEGEACCLLRGDRCRFYERRPLICRTHGLPLVSVELTGGEVDCCPLNLPALAKVGELEADLVLDLELVTENLLRLNLALFMVLRRPELAECRFPLSSLAGGGKVLPEELRAIARELDFDDGR